MGNYFGYEGHIGSSDTFHGEHVLFDGNCRQKINPLKTRSSALLNDTKFAPHLSIAAPRLESKSSKSQAFSYSYKSPSYGTIY
jgi:hypothetical protein